MHPILLQLGPLTLRTYGLMTAISFALGIFLCVCVTVLAPYPLFFVSQRTQQLPILGISSAFVAIWIAIGLVLMVLFTLEKLAALPWRNLGRGAAVPGAITPTTV